MRRPRVVRPRVERRGRDDGQPLLQGSLLLRRCGPTHSRREPPAFRIARQINGKFGCLS
jgi:hypothetical protein